MPVLAAVTQHFHAGGRVRPDGRAGLRAVRQPARQPASRQWGFQRDMDITVDLRDKRLASALRRVEQVRLVCMSSWGRQLHGTRWIKRAQTMIVVWQQRMNS